MRDIDRIKPFMEELTKLWERVPDQRFGQLISNVLRNRDPFYIEDDAAMKCFKEFFRNGGNR